MRRSICYCEPNSALAGEASNWRFVYTTASHLPRGSKVRFDLDSKGRPNDWQIPKTNLKEKTNVIWLEPPGGKPIAGSALQHPQNLTTSFEFILPSEMKSGESFVISGHKAALTD